MEWQCVDLQSEKIFTNPKVKFLFANRFQLTLDRAKNQRKLAPFKIISLWGPMHVWTYVKKIPKIISCGENEVEDLQLVIVQLVHSTDHLI